MSASEGEQTPSVIDARFAAIRHTYEVVERHVFSDYRPPDLSRAAGMIDLHVHAGPGRQDPLALGKHASLAGARAIVLKNPLLGDTVQMAKEARTALETWAEGAGVAPTRIVASHVLGAARGGVSPAVVDRAVAQGAEVIWMPVLDATNHLRRAKGVEDPAAAGISVVEDGSLTRAAQDAVAACAAAGVAMSFGHVSRDEMFALADECVALGYDRVFVDHPFSPVAGLTVSDIVELASAGVTCNFTYWELSPYCGVTATEMATAIRTIGPEHVTMSSDAGMEIFPDSVECMRLHDAMLDLFGYEPDARAAMMHDNAARILGV